MFYASNIGLPLIFMF